MGHRCDIRPSCCMLETGFARLMLTCLSHKIVNNWTGMHSTSLWLAFLASVQHGRVLEPFSPAYRKEEVWNLSRQRTARKSSGTHFRSVQWHCHAYHKYAGGLGHLFTLDTLNGTTDVRIIEVPLYTDALNSFPGPWWEPGNEASIHKTTSLSSQCWINPGYH